MTYFQYLFSDKKPAIYWTITLIIISLLTILKAILTSNGTLYNSFWDYFQIYFYLVIYFVIYFGFYTSGYLTYKKQKRFILFYKSKIEKDTIREVLIYQDKFKIKAFRQNYDLTIMIPPKKDYYQLCKIGDSIIVLGQVYDFGVFKRHMRPFQIDLNNSNNAKYKYAIKPSIYNIDTNNNNLEITFRNSLSGINKLVIKNYE